MLARTAIPILLAFPTALVMALAPAAPLAHADPQYVGMAIYDPPGPTVEVIHEDNESSPTAAISHALARCNSEYYSQCQPVGVSTTCISVVAGPGVEWVFATGPDMSSAAANAQARAGQNGWDRSVEPVSHCSWGD
jgi:Domain of unknown function (DUF4189)